MTIYIQELVEEIPTKTRKKTNSFDSRVFYNFDPSVIDCSMMRELLCENVAGCKTEPFLDFGFGLCKVYDG
ncbi:hypothetical protein QR98_0028840 [Sarcoptes scabiei]|uniref:Uncharacterized protein n=1 Tax=Sarcoptes scabiei TaxID=52283 RepID=A0A132A0H2_SARSC|nr:hypothetical protein QR98_0028840 [Sarcoptes scabiei]